MNGVSFGSRSTVALRNVMLNGSFFGTANWANNDIDANYDEMKIHSRALSHQEILADMNYNKSYF
jgi:hypothetical protein